MLMLEDGNEGQDEPEEELRVEEVAGQAAVKVGVTNIALSINSIVGISTISKTLKVKGEIAGQEVVVLVDSGPSYYFISRDLVWKLSIPVEGTQSFGVEVGNGYRVLREGVCKGIVVELPGLKIQEDFYPSDTGSADVVFGVSWLEKLGEFSSNFREMTMTIRVAGEQVVLQRDLSLTKNLSCKNMIKQMGRGDGGYMVELGEVQQAEE